MADVTRTVCDVCGADSASSYTISSGRVKPWTVDLCQEHAAPIEGLRKHGRVPSKRRAYRDFNRSIAG
jgi:hypothetical protein